ncbi:hypothetical protein GJAV_G00172660 [Gymnothorax javanicus]|nr:hypothetical protein GJAV_G00172660 [Gymnothorax javanicus]
MASHRLINSIIFLLCLGGCHCQKDCTGVTCPVLDNCLEEVLEKGECCASCLQTGCTCENYQYYDCVNAGFRNGKVPEGESYFVDFGSTECSCPEGGGNISCHFIPCPELPANCIDFLEPADGCMQCERVGCIHNEQKYEAGNSFHLDQCQVCHCPNEGGDLMCYVVPDCASEGAQKPILALTSEENSPDRQDKDPYISEQDPLSKLYPLSHSDTVTRFKQDTFHMDEEEDYDYTPEGPATGVLPDQYFPTASALIPFPQPEATIPQDFGQAEKQELKEVIGTYEKAPDMDEETTDTPQTVDETTPSLQRVESTSGGASENQIHQQGVDTIKEGKKWEVDQAVTSKAATEMTSAGNDLSITADSKDERANNDLGNESYNDLGRQDRQPETRSQQPQNPKDHSISPLVKFSPTSQPLVNIKGDDGHPPTKQPQTLFNYQTEEEEEEQREEEGTNALDSLPEHHQVSAVDLVENCCSVGQKWAISNDHCNDLPAAKEDRYSICRIAQFQCCAGFLKERMCLAGMNAARGGDACEAEDSDACGTDSFKDCCECCSLGKRFHAEGQGCEPHQYLGYPCGHIFMTCCQGEEGLSMPTIRKRERPRPTALPKKVSDRRFQNEAFSISDRDEAENSVEEPEDVDECQLYAGQLCHHMCVNTWGSYECACFQGYVLLQDGHICVPETQLEDNQVLEEKPPTEAPQTSTPAAPTTPIPVKPDPCEANGPCKQRCSAVEREAHCSCFAGYYLLADGVSCEDVNECLTNTHSCLANETCLNTIGSFVCEKRITCPTGYQMRSGVCEDLDECKLRTHNCGIGSDCQNTDGSFTCKPRPKCPAGFAQDALGNCIDVNECSSLEEPCSSGFNCINTVGSYTCQRKIIVCSQGYHASTDGTRCVDVDECQTGVHRCSAGQICQNLPGTYRCDCQTGYQYDMIRRVCVDVNECWRYPGRLCGQTCENTPGSYRCTCTVGFTLAFDGKNCEDVNECTNNPCSQECANIYGSYQCYCRQGFYLKEDGHTCQDIDECSQSVGNLCAFQCVNVPGSYQCACPPEGYTLSPNGRTCRDIDECAIGAHNCSTAETCYNIQGSYRCLSFACPPNYRRVSDIRCERISCPNFLDCQNSPLRITYYQLSFQTNIIIPAQIFRIGPSPVYSGDNIIISITRGNEENYFSTRKLNAFTGAVYLQRQVREAKDFLIDVEMKLLRQGTFTTFLARIYVFVTAHSL